MFNNQTYEEIIFDYEYITFLLKTTSSTSMLQPVTTSLCVHKLLNLKFCVYRTSKLSFNVVDYILSKLTEFICYTKEIEAQDYAQSMIELLIRKYERYEFTPNVNI